MIKNNPNKWLSDNEERLQMEYARIRRYEFLKKGKKYSIEKISEIVTKEWLSLRDDQKIAMH